MKLYCPSCGASNSYTVEKPNFCQKCGNSTGGKKTAQGNLLTTDSEEHEAESVPSVNKLDFDIVGDLSPRGITLGTLSQLRSEIIDSSVKPKKKKPPRISKKKVLEDFQKEAGTIRPDNG